MAKKLTKTSVLASVLVAGCILGVQKVYAEETTTNTIAVSQSTTEVGVSNLTTIPATEMASDTTPQTVITEQESLDTFSETEGAQEQQSLITSTDSTTVATEESINSEATEKVTDEASSTQKTQLDLVDEQASQETKELFDYLKTKAASKEILFGQQHALDEGVTLTGEGSRAGSTESEVKNAIGDYPAVFGWDTLALDGHENTWSATNHLPNLVQYLELLHDLGGKN
ncbi:MAG: glycosyl hydrolase [Streptococcus orisratti]|nr:glycosyl hydrolase [Streptococcus orisratti]